MQSSMLVGIILLFSFSLMFSSNQLSPVYGQICEIGTEVFPDDNSCFAIIPLDCPENYDLITETECGGPPISGCPGDLQFDLSFGACVKEIPTLTCPGDSTISSPDGLCKDDLVSIDCPTDTTIDEDFGACEFDRCSSSIFSSCTPDCPSEGRIVSTVSLPLNTIRICLVPPTQTTCTDGTEYDFDSGRCIASVLGCPDGVGAADLGLGPICFAFPLGLGCSEEFDLNQFSGQCITDPEMLDCPTDTTADLRFGGCVEATCVGSFSTCNAQLACDDPEKRQDSRTSGFIFQTTTHFCLVQPNSATCPGQTTYDFFEGGCTEAADPLFCPANFDPIQSPIIPGEFLCVGNVTELPCPAGSELDESLGAPFPLCIAQILDEESTNAEKIQSLIDDIDATNLDERTKRSLQWLLNAAFDLAQAEDHDATVKKLQEFLSRLDMLIGRGFVTPEIGQPLIDSAQLIIESDPGVGILAPG